MSEIIPHLGEIFAILTAVIWAYAVVLFKKSGESVPPLALNLFKNFLAFVLFIPTMLIMGSTIFRPVPFSEYLLLMASGAIGIGIGDTLFFKSLNRVGAGISAIISCMYSPLMIGMSVLWLDERLTIIQVIGVLLIVSALLTTASTKHEKTLKPKDLLLGITWGVLGTLAMVIGVIMIKPLLNRSPLLWSIEVRLTGGLLILALITMFHPMRRQMISSIYKDKKSFGYTFTSSFLGAYLAMFLWLGGMKFTQVSTASILNQTSNVFIFIFAALLLKESVTPRKTIAILLAVFGAILVSCF